MPIEIPKDKPGKVADKQKRQQPNKQPGKQINQNRQKGKPIVDPPFFVDEATFDTAGVHPEPPDNFGGDYILGRQIAHEFHSPAVQLMVAHKPQVQGLKATHFSTEEAQRQIQSDKPLEDPWIDPTMAFAGGAGAVTKLSMAQGMKLMPSLARGLSAGLVGAAADFPIGKATESLEEVVPGAAIPFNLAVGMVSGATLEKAIEDSVIRLGGKGKGVAKAVYDELLSGEPTTDLGKKVKAEFDDAMEFFKGKISDESGEIKLGDDDPKKGWESVAKSIEAEKAKPEESVIPSTELAISDDLNYMDKLNIRPTKSGDVLLADNINLDRVDSTENLAEIMARTAKAFEGKIDEAKRGVVTNVETQRLADLTGMTVESLLKRRSGQAFNGHEALAARKILVSSAENLVQLARKIKKLDATDADRFALRRAMSMHYAIQAQVSGMTAEAGRALQAFKIPAGSAENQTKAIKEVLNNMPEGMDIDKMADALSTYEYADQVGTFIKQAQRATSLDMLIEAWINGLLSGPQTHAVNTISNSMTALYLIPERLLASGISKVLRTNGGVKVGEARVQGYGLVEGAKDGIKAMSKTIRTGEPSDALSKIEQNKYRAITAENIQQLPLIKKLAPNAFVEGGIAAQFADLAGGVIRTPGRLLAAEDEFFKAIGYRMELRAQAYRRASDEGHKGDDFSKRIAEILADPETNAPDIHAASIDAMRYQTYTKPLGSTGQKIQGVLNDVPALRLIAPFIRTPTNIMKFAGERTPLAPLSRKVRAEIAAGGARRDMALARISMGSMVMATAATMAAQGYITGGGPVDPKQRGGLRRTGWQPYSVKIGDKYVAFNRLEPIGMLFGVAADFSEIAGFAGSDMQPEIDDLATAITFAISKNATSKTWLKGVGDAVHAMDDPKRYGGQFLHGYARSLVPSAIGQIERTMDPELEAVYSMMDAVKGRIPGISNTLPKKRDLWGNQISTAIDPEKGRSWAEASLSLANPFYISTEKSTPIDEELKRLDHPISKPKRTQSFDGVTIRLDPWVYDYFIERMNTRKLESTGKNLKDSLNDLVSSDGFYKSLPGELKESRIRAVFNEAKQLAKIDLRKEFPDLDTVIISERDKQLMELSQ